MEQSERDDLDLQVIENMTGGELKRAVQRNEVSTADSTISTAESVRYITGQPARESVYKQAIEYMIYKQGVSGLLDLVGEVCREKEQHIEANWPDDKALARVWWAAAVHVEHASNLITLVGL